MGRGSSDQATRSARSLLFGPRRNFIQTDPAAAIASARAQLKNGQNGPAMVLLRRYSDKIGSDEAVDGLMGDIASQAVMSSLPEGDDYIFNRFRLDTDYDRPAINFSDKKEELSYVSSSLADDLVGQLKDNSGPIELDKDRVRDSVFASPALGKFNQRFLAVMDDNELLVTTYNLRDSNSALAEALRERMASNLVAKVEEGARELITNFSMAGRGAEKVTFLRRGSYGKATLLHLTEDGQTTLCHKSTGYYSNYTARGSWRNADETDHKRCKKCEKAMPEDFFRPAEESDNYSLLDRAEYEKLRRKAARKVRDLLAGNSAPTTEMVEAAAAEMARAIEPIERKAIGQRIYEHLNTEPVVMNRVRGLIGWSMGSALYQKYDYDMSKVTLPTARQFAGALKGWQEKDSDQIELDMAKLFFRANGKRIPKDLLS